MSESEDRVRITIEAGVADVQLVRADKMNALDIAMFEAILAAGERLMTEPGVRAVVLSGEGRSFCSGLDTSNIKRMAETNAIAPAVDLLNTERTPGGANRAQQGVMVWKELPVPVIGAIHGAAFGGGCQLALGCDIRFVAPDVKMSLMEIKWGLVPDMAGFALLRGLMRDDVARELIWSGRVLNGEEAVATGLATRVCADPRAEALAFAREIANRNPHAIRASKRILNLGIEGSQVDVLKAETVEQLKLLRSPNQVEAVTANMEKRAPKFAA